MYYAKRNKSISERQIYDFTHVGFSKTDEYMGRGEREKREVNHKRLLMIENKLRVGGGRWMGDGLDGCWVLRRAFEMSTGYCM